MRAALPGGVAAPAPAGTHSLQGDYGDDGHDEDDDDRLEEALANATVSFGTWSAEPPPDRFASLNPIARTVHRRFPFEATVRAGGTINFMIGGFHHILIYGPGTKFDDINRALTVPMPNAPADFPPVVNDPVNRVYRGLSPFGRTQDRVETVQLVKPGRYLVVCGFVPHFDDRMFGFVRVVR